MSRFSINKQSQNEVRSLIHRLRSYRLVRNLLIGFILVSICNLLFSSLFYTPKMFRLADEKRELKDALRKGRDILILIGPEGDFSEKEKKKAIAEGFVPVGLGRSRLRTETAGVVACHTAVLLNED